MSEGTIYTYTVIHIAPEGFEEFVPYACVIAETADGERKTLRLIETSDLAEIAIGRRVEIIDESTCKLIN